MLGGGRGGSGVRTPLAQGTWRWVGARPGGVQPQLGYWSAHGQEGAGWVWRGLGEVGVACLRLAFSFRVGGRKQTAGCAQAYPSKCKHMEGSASILLSQCGGCRCIIGCRIGMLGAGRKHIMGARKHTRGVSGVGASILCVVVWGAKTLWVSHTCLWVMLDSPQTAWGGLQHAYGGRKHTRVGGWWCAQADYGVRASKPGRRPTVLPGVSKTHTTVTTAHHCVF